MLRRERLVVMCLLDGDVHRDLRMRRCGSGRSRIDAGVVRALRRLYSDVCIQPVWRVDAALDAIGRRRPDVLFNLAYASTEAESTFVASLEACGVPFTGSGAATLALLNDKARTRVVLEEQGVQVPRWVEMAVGDRRVRATFKSPVLVKPSRYAGSSYGINANSVVSSKGDILTHAARLWERFGEPVICDEFIVGREFRVGAVQAADTGAFDTVNATETVFPLASNGWGIKTQSVRCNDRVRLAQRVNTMVVGSQQPEYRELRALARQVARACGVRGYFSMDVRTDQHGRHHVIDVNGNPGLSADGKIWGHPSFGHILAQIVSTAVAAGSR